MENLSSKPSNYKDLRVWQNSRNLVKQLYLMTQKFPQEERFGLVSQMRRAAVSIPSNIAEGCGRQHHKDTIQFLVVARGSAYELETQCYLAFDLSLITHEDLEQMQNQLTNCIQLIQGFIRYHRTLA